MLIVPGQHGLWAVCVKSQNRCWRNDDGSLMVDVDESGKIHPLPPPGEFIPLEVSLSQAIPEKINAGEVLEIGITLKNPTKSRAYWVGVSAVETKAMPTWALEPVTLPFVEAGETVTIKARLHPHTDSLNPKPVALTARLAITQAYGSAIELPTTIKTTVEPPVLRIVEARRLASKDQQAIALTLENQGSALPRTQFRIGIPGLQPDRQPAELTQDGLLAGGKVTLSFGLPSDLKTVRDLKIALYGQKQPADLANAFPLYDWEFKDVPVIPPGPAWPVYAAAVLLALLLSGSVHYVRVYRHPLVLRLSARPGDLRDFDPGELPAARRALERARRFAAVLQTGQVPLAWFELAAGFDKLDSAEERGQRLAGRLGRDIARADNGRLWQIELGDDFPLNLARLRLCLPDSTLPAADVLNRLGSPPEVTLLVGADGPQRQALAALARQRGGLWVVPAGRELTALLLADDPLDALARLIARQVPVTLVSPYQTGAGVHKQGLFFGRGSLVAQIMGGNPANYLLVGGRQVGKSSLLKELERRYRNDPAVDCHYLVLSGHDAGSRLAEALALPADCGLEAVLARLRSGDGPRKLFLIDEADAFVEQDRRQAYASLQKLRALSEEGRAHFILAGFWSLYQQAALDYQSPLKNFGSVLTVGALELEACQALAVEPMARLGIRWASDDLIAELIGQTGQRANLISIACDQALWALGQTERVITPAHLQNVLDADRLRDALLGWADLSGEEADDRLDRVVVYATAPLEEAFGLAEVIGLLEAAGCRPEPERLKRAIARLELAFVLGREGNRYGYRVPLQRALVVSDDTGLLLRREIAAMGRPQ